MRNIKRLFIVSFTILLTLCMSISLSGCHKIKFNAVIIKDGIVYQTEWLENNYTFGAGLDNAYGYDNTSPKSRTYIVKSSNELDDIFETFPAIDFKKEMVLIYCYTSIYAREHVLEKVSLKDNVLNVEFNVVKGKIGRADACAPHRRILSVKLDKLDITDAKVTYNGQ